MRQWLRTPAAWTTLLAIVLAFGLLGARGIWDPDEGRYTNVALNMLDSGDWLNPHRSDEVAHWTKPPLTYWVIASSIAVFGHNPWAARLPSALSFLLCTWLAWRVAGRLVPAARMPAAVAYATMLVTFGASHMITTDYLLSACVGAAMWAFVESRFGPIGRKRWIILIWITLMWAAFALGFLTKGPPALLYLLVVLGFNALMPQRHGRVLQLSGIVVFVLLALPWYVAVIANHPGLLRYYIGDEVVNRVTTNDFGRNGEWYGWLKVYAPTLLVGTLPWTPALWRWARALPRRLRDWRDRTRRDADAAGVLLALWLLVPLMVFCLARSRMPLYLLPSFLPLAVIIARQRWQEGRSPPRWRWLAAWAALLLVLQVAAAKWPTHKDASAWADTIRSRAHHTVTEVLFVQDMARYGLHLHLDAQVEKISLAPLRGPRFDPEYDESLAQELARGEPGQVWICKQGLWPQLRDELAARGYRAEPLGAPYQRRVIFEVVKR
ncbi:ArnT family glycosyltransferase [Lysobacter fragariae]